MFWNFIGHGNVVTSEVTGDKGLEVPSKTIYCVKKETHHETNDILSNSYVPLLNITLLGNADGTTHVQNQ